MKRSIALVLSLIIASIQGMDDLRIKLQNRSHAPCTHTIYFKLQVMGVAIPEDSDYLAHDYDFLHGIPKKKWLVLKTDSGVTFRVYNEKDTSGTWAVVKKEVASDQTHDENELIEIARLKVLKEQILLVTLSTGNRITVKIITHD